LLAQSALFIGESPPLKGSRAARVLEFGRVVHAEMSAITDSTRRGIGVKDTTRYCTTFPCRMYAQHIIAAGLAPVVHIEPYPKTSSIPMQFLLTLIPPRQRMWWVLVPLTGRDPVAIWIYSTCRCLGRIQPVER
jgi:hypothetical protein